MQAQNGHSPPTSSLSTTATRRSAAARPRAAWRPPGPAPITTASNRCTAPMKCGSLLARFELGRECAGGALATGHELRLAEQVAHERAHEARADQLQPDRLDVDVGANALPGLLRGQERRDRLDAAMRAQVLRDHAAAELLAQLRVALDGREDRHHPREEPLEGARDLVQALGQRPLDEVPELGGVDLAHGLEAQLDHGLNEPDLVLEVVVDAGLGGAGALGDLLRRQPAEA